MSSHAPADYVCPIIGEHMELVDVVNEHDEVLRQADKQECHQKGLLHRTVIGELIDSKGNWTLVRQAKDKQDAGQYVSPVGGHVKAGETAEAALKRETFEELGIQEFEYKFVGKKILNREVIGRKENHFFLVYEIYSNQVPVLNHESDAFEAFTPDELKNALKNNPSKFGDAFHFVMQNFY